MTKKTIPIFAKRSSEQPTEILSEEAYHFSVGSLLGDATLSAKDKNMEWEQRSPTFALWKRNKCLQYGLITKIIPSSPFQIKFANNLIIQLPLRLKVIPAKKNSKYQIYRSAYFSTRAMYHAKEWRELFYTEKTGQQVGRVKYRKQIPPNISEYFWGNYALAIWFLDDGWFDWQKHTVRFSTEEWPREECEYLVKCLKTNFNLDSVVYPKTGKPHHIYVHPNSYEQFFNCVKSTLNDFEQAYPRYYFLNKSMKNKRIMPPKV
jgi:hypothetical protein